MPFSSTCALEVREQLWRLDSILSRHLVGSNKSNSGQQAREEAPKTQALKEVLLLYFPITHKIICRNDLRHHLD